MSEQHPIHTILGELPTRITNGNTLKKQAVLDLVNTHISDSMIDIPTLDLESLSSEDKRLLGMLALGIIHLQQELTSTQGLMTNEQRTLLRKVILLRISLNRNRD